MTKEIKATETWLDDLAAAMNDVGTLIEDNDVFTSYDLGLLYDLQQRLLNRFNEKQSLLIKLKSEEETNVDG